MIVNLIRSGEIRKKLLLSGLVTIIGVLSYTNVINTAFEKTFIGKLNENSQVYLDDTLRKAIYTYAVVRGINGVISVIQNSKVDISPAGIGVNMAFGEILDPVNDLVERFSWVMLVSTTALGIQKILLSLGTWLGLNVLLSLSMVVLLVGIWIPHQITDRLVPLGYRLIVVSCAIWLCVPMVTLAGNRIYGLFLEESYTEATKSLDILDKELKEADIVAAHTPRKEGEAGLIEDVKNYFEDAKQTLNINARLKLLKDKLSDYAEYTIHLIIVFISQTIVLPLLFLWIFIRSCVFLFRFGGSITDRSI